MKLSTEEEKPLNVQGSRDWQIKEHERVLTLSKKVIARAMILASANAFCFASTTNIAVLYARQFEDNISVISWVIWSSSVSFSFLSLLTSTLAEFLGFDLLLAVVFLVSGIGMVLQACATNQTGGFVMWSIGYILSKQPVMFIFIGYIAALLPLTDSKQYTGTFYQLFAAFYLLGPLASGQ